MLVFIIFYNTYENKGSPSIWRSITLLFWITSIFNHLTTHIVTKSDIFGFVNIFSETSVESRRPVIGHRNSKGQFFRRSGVQACGGDNGLHHERCLSVRIGTIRLLSRHLRSGTDGNSWEITDWDLNIEFAKLVS